MSRGPVLVTGFEPFGEEPVNPAWEIVRALPRALGETSDGRLVTARLPVDRARLVPAVDDLLATHRPAVVLAVGQATGRAEVHVEARAVNHLRYEGAVDNGGHADVDEPVVADGPEALEATLPVDALVGELRAAGLPVARSDDAGRYLCNALLFHLLHAHGPVPSTFVHVPLLPDQAERRGQGEASLALETSAEVVSRLVRRLLDDGPAPAARG